MCSGKEELEQNEEQIIHNYAKAEEFPGPNTAAVVSLESIDERETLDPGAASDCTPIAVFWFRVMSIEFFLAQEAGYPIVHSFGAFGHVSPRVHGTDQFVKAFRALHSFRGDSAFYTWLYRIAINTAKNALVATKRRPMDYDLDLQDPEQYDLHARLAESETPEGLLLTDEIRDTVNRAIENLPEDLRTAIVLRELEGLSYEDIAQTMDCPVGTVRSRIFRAREAIDKKLRPIFDGGLGRPEDT